MNLIVHAPNVHQGGGKTLLLTLLEAAAKQCDTVALLDQRLEVPKELDEAVTIVRVVPTISGRLAGEWRLRRLARDDDRVLCFGNLPPLFKVKGRITVFLQNRYLTNQCPLGGFPPRVKWRLTVERLWLRYCRAHADSFVVQTNSMRDAAAQVVGPTVLVVPFSPDCSDIAKQGTQELPQYTTSYEFLYAASGDPHKNHRNLLDAWKLLALEGLYPSLCLTVSRFDYPSLADLIEREKTDHNLRIDNVPAHSRSDMQRLYGCARALIYPSLMESFGLPLIEAQQAGLSIIAAELDYVRDLVDPKEVFDPHSPRSIARAIKRFLHISQPPVSVLTSDEFVQRLLAA